VHITHSNIHTIRATALIAAGTPLCTEIIMAKGRISMIMAEPIFHIITSMINTMPGPSGITTIQGMNGTKDIMAILLTMKIVANITVTMTIITTTLAVETLINSLAII
jgi:hypothetical protein